MNLLAMAMDFDGTIAHDGQVEDGTIAALRRLVDSGRRLILVTGRELKDLLRVFPEIEIFDRVVAENGAVLYCPHTRETRLLTERAPEKLVSALRDRNITPLSVGECVIATWHPQECTVLETIRDLGVERQISFNKGAVMILPTGVNKASGLTAALSDLELSPHNVVAVGDAENDLPFLEMCQCSVAVANALDGVKERVAFVTTGNRGAGVTELVERLVRDDMDTLLSRMERNRILLGTERDDRAKRVDLPVLGSSILVAGPSGTGKSTVVTGILERFAELGYQFCLFDPEGDYEDFAHGVSLGGPHHPPQPRVVFQLLQKMQNPIVNLLGIGLDQRAQFMAELLPKLQELRAKTGRPHWIVVDEMHHMFPSKWEPASTTVPQALKGLLGITVHAQQVATPVLRNMDTVLAVGDRPDRTIEDFCKAIGVAAPDVPDLKLDKLEVVMWSVHDGSEIKVVCATPGKTDRKRHLRKYSAGDLHEKSFVFRGPRATLNLRAQNLMVFLQMAEGVDDETWTHHLHQHDYSRWVEGSIKDTELAGQLRDIEAKDASPMKSRKEVCEAVRAKYTAAE